MTDHEHVTVTVPPPSPTTGLPAYPAQQPWGHYDYARLAPVKQTTAVWAIVLAVVPLPVGWLVSIGLAISVISQSRDGRGRERGRGMAIAALVIATLWIAAFVALMAGGGLVGGPERDVGGQVTSSGDASVESLHTGDCLAELPKTGRSAITVPVVPCSHHHVAQVFAEFDMEKGAYPGDADVARLAEGGCLRRFEQRFASAAGRDELRLFYLHPLASNWSKSREVTCLATTVSSRA